MPTTKVPVYYSSTDARGTDRKAKSESTECYRKPDHAQIRWQAFYSSIRTEAVLCTRSTPLPVMLTSFPLPRFCSVSSMNVPYLSDTKCSRLRLQFVFQTSGPRYSNARLQQSNPSLLYATCSDDKMTPTAKLKKPTQATHPCICMSTHRGTNPRRFPCMAFALDKRAPCDRCS